MMTWPTVLEGACAIGGGRGQRRFLITAGSPPRDRSRNDLIIEIIPEMIIPAP